MVSNFSFDNASLVVKVLGISNEKGTPFMQTGLAQAKADDSLAMDDAFNQLKAEI